jgi:hypothetical protein
VAPLTLLASTGRWPKRSFLLSSPPVVLALQWGSRSKQEQRSYTHPGVRFRHLVRVHLSPNKQRAPKSSNQFSHILPRDSRCTCGQIDNRKHMLGRFRSHFQTNSMRVDLKKTSRPFISVM